jgi:hypothetical protein
VHVAFSCLYHIMFTFFYHRLQFVTYVIEMCFSHMLCSPRYAKYEVMTLIVMLMRCIDVLLVALGCICLWMAFLL